MTSETAEHADTRVPADMKGEKTSDRKKISDLQIYWFSMNVEIQYKCV